MPRVTIGLRTADLHIRADARAVAETIIRRLKERGIRRPSWRSNSVAAKIAADVRDIKEFAVTPGTLDLQPVLRELDRAIPRIGTSWLRAVIASAL